MRPLRICMVTTFYPPYTFGGDGIAVQRLSRALVRGGHQVTVIHSEEAYRALGGHSEADDSPEDGVRVIRLRSRLGALSPLLVQQLGRPVLHARRLRTLLGPGQWDVINFHNVSLVGGPGILTYPTGTATVYMAHEHWLVCPTHVLWRYNREPCDARDCLRCVLAHRRPPQLWRYTGALRRGLQNIDALVALSEFSRTRHREFGLDREMEVLPSFLPDDELKAPGHGRDEPSSRRPYFLVCGRVEPAKGLEDAIDAFRQLPEADLVIAGSGSDEARLRERAARQTNIRWLGQCPPEELRQWYRGAVAAIAPSKGYETFGLVLIEAFREGVPVLARNRGSFPEIVRCGGVLFDTAADLRTAAAELLAVPAWRAELAREAREAYLSHYAEERVLPAYLDIVQTAIDRRAKRAA